jgi:hypothetical protein
MASPSTTWSITLLTELPNPIPTTGYYLVPLYSTETPFTSLTVQFPLSLGLLAGKDATILPNGIPTTVDNVLVLGFTDLPPMISFASLAPQKTGHRTIHQVRSIPQ